YTTVLRQYLSPMTGIRDYRERSVAALDNCGNSIGEGRVPKGLSAIWFAHAAVGPQSGIDGEWHKVVQLLSLCTKRTSRCSRTRTNRDASRSWWLRSGQNSPHSQIERTKGLAIPQ